MSQRPPSKGLRRGAAQAGFTLAELMVGMTIGLLGVLAMIALYVAMSRQVEGSATEPGMRQRSENDGQVALAIITLQYDLQRAGFGINSPKLGVDLISAGAPINALGWRWVNAATNVTECAAMRYRATANVATSSETGGPLGAVNPFSLIGSAVHSEQSACSMR